MSGANKRRLSEVIVVADDSTAPPPPPPEVLASWTVPPPALLEAWIAHHPELRGVLLRVLPGHWLGSIALNTIGRAMVDGSHLDGPAVWVNTDMSKHLDGGSIALLLKYLTPTWFSLCATELGHDAATLYHPLAWHTMYFPINKDDVHWALIVLRLGRLYLLDSQERASILDIAAHGILNWLTRFYAINNFLGLDACPSAPCPDSQAVVPPIEGRVGVWVVHSVFRSACAGGGWAPHTCCGHPRGGTRPPHNRYRLRMCSDVQRGAQHSVTTCTVCSPPWRGVNSARR